MSSDGNTIYHRQRDDSFITYTSTTPARLRHIANSQYHPTDNTIITLPNHVCPAHTIHYGSYLQIESFACASSSNLIIPIGPDWTTSVIHIAPAPISSLHYAITATSTISEARRSVQDHQTHKIPIGLSSPAL